MSESNRAASTTKTFGKSTREIPHQSQKAQKWYPVEDEAQPKKVLHIVHENIVMIKSAIL